MFGLAGNSRPASRTAQYMALFRALESQRPAGERLFCDPFAAWFLRPSLRLAVRAAALPVLGRLLSSFLDRRWPGVRSSGVARTRLIDDALVVALHEGFEQVVLLGAGFDARAYRLAGIERARVFEVDHAATSGAKRSVVGARIGRVPDHVTFVEVDFERDDLPCKLTAAGFRTDARAFFVWEGVTNYLTDDAVDATLRAIAAVAARGSRLLFTYVHRGVLDGSMSFATTRHLAATLRRVGEPWTFGLDPAETGAYLARRGFRLLWDQGACEYRARYMGEPGRGYEFYRAALAQVDAAPPVPASQRSGDADRSQPCPR